jgi:hypothetical protein
MVLSSLYYLDVYEKILIIGQNERSGPNLINLFAAVIYKCSVMNQCLILANFSSLV